MKANVVFYRVEARKRLGDRPGYIEDVRRANIPPALSRLGALEEAPEGPLLRRSRVREVTR